MITDIKKLQDELVKWKHRALVAEAKCATMRDPRWPKVRAAHLKKEPTCQACGGTEGLECHHVTPFHVDKRKELSDKNLISLCEVKGKECHLRIGHNSNWKLYNKNVREDAAAALAKVKQ